MITENINLNNETNPLAPQAIRDYKLVLNLNIFKIREGLKVPVSG
jgi:hypothetical protein